MKNFSDNIILNFGYCGLKPNQIHRLKHKTVIGNTQKT